MPQVQSKKHRYAERSQPHDIRHSMLSFKLGSTFANDSADVLEIF